MHFGSKQDLFQCQIEMAINLKGNALGSHAKKR